MADLSVQVEGAAELRRAFRKAGDRSLDDALKSANRQVADLIAASTRRDVPHRTGKLAASVRPTATARYGSVVMGNAKTPYAGAIYWGRKRGNVGSPPGNHKGANRIPGNDVFRDAMNRAGAQAAALYEREVGHVLARLFD